MQDRKPTLSVWTNQNYGVRGAVLNVRHELVHHAGFLEAAEICARMR
jgi:hypothetical protein